MLNEYVFSRKTLNHLRWIGRGGLLAIVVSNNLKNESNYVFYGLYGCREVGVRAPFQRLVVEVFESISLERMHGWVENTDERFHAHAKR
jgi:hypothetical protein